MNQKISSFEIWAETFESTTLLKTLATVCELRLEELYKLLAEMEMANLFEQHGNGTLTRATHGKLLPEWFAFEAKFTFIRAQFSESMSHNKGKLLNFGLPKGSLENCHPSLFDKAGYNISVSSRSYRPSFDDPELDGRFVRAQEISRFVEYGFFDCGLTGHDWVVENESDVVEVCELVYSRASNVTSKWVLAVPESSEVKEVKDLQGKRIATEVVRLTKAFLKNMT